MKNPRLFRHTPGTLQKLTQNTAHNWAAQHALVHFPSGSVYSFIPKNGCTTMRVSLALANGCIADPRQEWDWVHKNNTTFAASLRDLAVAPFSFVILRCPFSRLASTFLDKIVSKDVPFWILYEGERRSFSPDDLTFRRFVASIAKGNNLRMEEHWRPQTDFLVYDNYDAWYAFEQLSDALEDIAARTGMQIVDARPLSKHETQSAQEALSGSADISLRELSIMKAEGRLPRHEDLYDSALAKQVQELFKRDIQIYSEKFGASGLLFS